MHALTHEKKRPGSYGLVYNEILKENKMKEVKIPQSVIDLDRDDTDLEPIFTEKRTRQTCLIEDWDMDPSDVTEEESVALRRRYMGSTELYYSGPEAPHTKLTDELSETRLEQPEERLEQPEKTPRWSEMTEAEDEREEEQQEERVMRSSEKKKKKKKRDTDMEEVIGYIAQAAMKRKYILPRGVPGHPSAEASASSARSSPERTGAQGTTYVSEGRDSTQTGTSRRSSIRPNQGAKIRIVAPENRLLPKMDT